jgi:hypothetical protein
MQNRRLGCFTGTGLVAMLIALFVITCIGFASNGQIFSAGDLNAEQGQSRGGVNSHAQISECRACHTAPWETARMADRCVTCHTEITAEISDATQLHGVIMQNARTLSCRECHQEHRGASAALTDLGNNPFPHDALGFPLEGAHASVQCDKCHINNTFTGTPVDCYSCHVNDDKHNGQFGTDCSACHHPSGWSAVTFDHNHSSFPLTGAHANIACENCHQNGQFKGLDASCAACHGEPAFHAGAFGTDCASCHNTSNWGRATFNFSHPQPDADEGGRGINHGGATCRQCHVSNIFQATCSTCHDDDDFDDHGGGDNSGPGGSDDDGDGDDDNSGPGGGGDGDGDD